MDKHLDLEETMRKTVSLFNRLNSPQAVAKLVAVTPVMVVVSFSGPFCYECGGIQKYIDGFAKDFKIFISYIELTDGKARETTPHNVEVTYLVKSQ
jgi:hypothetical protein